MISIRPLLGKQIDTMLCDGRVRRANGTLLLLDPLTYHTDTAHSASELEVRLQFQVSGPILYLRFSSHTPGLPC